MSPRQDEFEKICFVDDGSGTLQIGEFGYCDEIDLQSPSQLPLKRGAVVHVKSGTTHRFLDSPEHPITLSVLCLNPAALAPQESLKKLWTSYAQKSDPLKLQQLSNPYVMSESARILRQIILELARMQPHCEAAILGLTAQLLVLLDRDLVTSQKSGGVDASDNFTASVAYLEDHFTEPLRIDLLAEIAGTSYRTYTDWFKKRLGMSAVQYWNSLRIELAKQRMLESKDIMGSALDAGFHDLSHFYKVFKRLTGETPREFISRH